MRNDALVRVLKIMRQLEGGGRYRLAQLAEEHQVSERTIRRDLYALGDIGVPIGHSRETDDGSPGWWWIER